MKKNKLFLCTILIAVLALIIPACGGSSGGGGGGHADGTFIKTPNLTDSANDVLPFPNNTTRLQILYPASEISGSGYINELIMFHGFGQATDTTCQNMTVKMGHTSLSTLSTTFSANVEEGRGSFITVINDANFSIPAGASGDEISIPLETSFYYNGVDNLVVEFTQNTACSQIVDTDSAMGLGDTRRVYDWPLDGTPDTAENSQTDANLIKFVFEGGDNTLFSNPTDSASVPFNDDANAQRQQQLYLASDINGSGPITGLGIQVASLTTEQTYTVTVNLGHATVTTLASDYDANYSDSPVTVANAVSFTIPADVPADSYVWIPLPDAVFTYNGTDNLIVEFDVAAATGVTAYTYHDHGSADIRLIYGPSDASVINPIGAAIHHIKLRFNGGTIDTLTAGNVSDTLPFNTSANQRQALYRATELGTGGRINRLALRATDDSVTSDYSNLTVMLGHTNLTELTATFADNMDDATTVFSGTFSIASGLKAGDWIEIPLSKSFRYNGVDNLVVYTRTDGGTAGNFIDGEGPDPLYANRRSYVLDNTSPAAISTNNYLMDQRLWLQ